MSSSLLQLGDTIWGGTDKIISFLRRNGLLASAKNCSRLAVFVRSDYRGKYQIFGRYQCSDTEYIIIRTQEDLLLPRLLMKVTLS